MARAVAALDPGVEMMGPRPLLEPLEEELLIATVEAGIFGTRAGVPLGRYRLHREIGRGGGGRVYEAIDPRLSRRVAIKLFGAGSAPAESFRVRRECEALARMSHPNVVDVYDVFEFPGGMAVVMEWIDGPHLGAWIRHSRPGRAEILRAFTDLGRGLAAVHRAGWLHRDVKPANVLVGPGGHVFLADFGLARVPEGSHAPQGPGVLPSTMGSTRVTRDGAVPGTPAYMAPEAIAGEPIDARSDQYSFCASLHEALHGVLPDREDPQIDRSLSRRVRSVLARGLSGYREDRYASMDELLLALDETSTGRPRTVFSIVLAGALAAAGAGWVGTTAEPGVPRPTRRGWADLDTFEGPELLQVSSDPIGRALSEAHAHETQGRYAEAARLYRQAVGVARGRGSRAQTQRALSKLGALLVLSGAVREGVGALEHAYEHAVEHDLDRAAARAATDLAFAVGYSMADHGGGLRWGRHAQAILDRIDAPGELQAKLDGHLGSVEALAGRYERAESLQLHAEAIRRDAGDPLGGELASTLNNLGNIYVVQGRLDEAENRHREALALRRDVFGSRHPLVSISLNNLASVAIGRGDDADAERLLVESVEVMESTTGPANRDLVHPLQNLSLLALRREDAIAAETYARRAKAIAEVEYDSEDPRVAMSLRSLGLALGQQQRYDEAMEAFFAALRIARSTLGDEHDDVASIRHAIGGAFLSMSRPAEALPYVAAARQWWRSQLDPDHVNVSASTLRVAMALVELGEARDARRLLERLQRRSGVRALSDHDRASVEFTLARAVVQTSTNGRGVARKLVASARARLTKDSARNRRLRGEIDAWAAEHDVG